MLNLKLKFSSLLFLFAIAFVACKNDSTTDTNSAQGIAINKNSTEVVLSMDELVKIVDAEPSQGNVQNLMKGIKRTLVDVKDDEVKKKATLERAVDLCKKYKADAFLMSYYLPLLKDYPTNPKNVNYIYDLGMVMKSKGLTSASDVIFSNFAKLYPSDARISDAKSMVSSDFKGMDTYIKDQADKVFLKKEGKKIDKKLVQEYVNACEAYALSNPNDKMTPTYLYKGSELARSTKSLEKVLSLYNWIVEKYPNYEKAPTVLFLKGFVIENETKNVKAAKIVYEEFLEKYPKHELADDVKFLVENLGKSNEEILKMIGGDKK